MAGLKLNEIKEPNYNGDILIKAGGKMKAAEKVFAVRCFLNGFCDLQ
jgi:hypothetical protein